VKKVKNLKCEIRKYRRRKIEVKPAENSESAWLAKKINGETGIESISINEKPKLIESGGRRW